MAQNNRGSQGNNQGSQGTNRGSQGFTSWNQGTSYGNERFGYPGGGNWNQGYGAGYWPGYGSQGNWGQNYGTGVYGEGFRNQGNWGQGYAYGSQGNWNQGYYGNQGYWGNEPSQPRNPGDWDVGAPGNQGYGYTGDWNRETWGAGYGHQHPPTDWQHQQQHQQTLPALSGPHPYTQAAEHGPFGLGQRQSGGGGPQGESNFRGVGPRNYRRSDERLREDVHDRFTDDPFLDATDIEVQVHDGLVTLTGTVPDRIQKWRAEDLADAVRGVTDVRNDLKVASAGQAAIG